MTLLGILLFLYMIHPILVLFPFPERKRNPDKDESR